MNFTYFSFSNAYIYSPITWLHNIRANYKIFLIFILLCLVPCFPFSYLLITTSGCLIIIGTLRFHQNYYHSCFGILLATLICLLPYYSNDTNYLIYKKIKIYIPYQIYNVFIEHRRLVKGTIIHNKEWIQLKIPAFIVQTGAIAILYSIILKTLLLTTMYEHIILSLYMYIKINNHYLKKVIFISFFANQFLEQTIKRARILYISIKLRNIDLITSTNKFSIYYCITAKFFDHIKGDIYKISSVLYSRELSNQNFEINNL